MVLLLVWLFSFYSFHYRITDGDYWRPTPPGWIVLYPGQNRGYLMASPQGWLFYHHYRHLELHGFTERTTLRAGCFISIIVTWLYRGYRKTGITLGFLTPEVSSPNSPGNIPGKWHPTTNTTPEGLTSNWLSEYCIPEIVIPCLKFNKLLQGFFVCLHCVGNPDIRSVIFQ